MTGDDIAILTSKSLDRFESLICRLNVWKNQIVYSSGAFQRILLTVPIYQIHQGINKEGKR